MHTVKAKTFSENAAQYKGTFTDVSMQMKYAYSEIEAANRAGIVMGSKGNFNPNDKITRQEIAALIIRAVEYKKIDFSETGTEAKRFADHGQISAYARNSVEKATALGIIDGKVANGTRIFEPRENASRMQSAKMLYKMLDLLGEF